MIVKKKRKLIMMGVKNYYILLVKSEYKEKCKHCELLKNHECLYRILSYNNNEALFYPCSKLGSYIPKLIVNGLSIIRVN
jgi:hypothetical protein